MSADDIYAALDRTALLLQRRRVRPRSWSPGHHRRAPRHHRAIIADRANLASPAGQTAAVTLYALLAMQGLQIDLDLPAVPLLVPRPPLAAGDLQAACWAMPPASCRAARPGPGRARRDVRHRRFARPPWRGPGQRHRLDGGRWRDRGQPALACRRGGRAHGRGRCGGGRRAARRRAADRWRWARLAPAAAWRLVPGRVTRLDLSTYQAGDPTGLGEVEGISGGAITSACLYALLRLPRAAARLRIIEPDRLEISNLNRYPLALRPCAAGRRPARWPRSRPPASASPGPTPASTRTPCRGWRRSRPGCWSVPITSPRGGQPSGPRRAGLAPGLAPTTSCSSRPTRPARPARAACTPGTRESP